MDYKFLKKGSSYFYDDTSFNHDLVEINNYKDELRNNYPYILLYKKIDIP